VEEALERVNARLVPEQPFRFTIGDEFQAVMETIALAVRAALWVRLETVGIIKVRLGIGWGELEILDADRSPVLQDGPCWWRAREAIKMVTDWEGRNLTPNSTAVLAVTADDHQDTLNAGLVLLDALVHRFDQTDVRMTRMLIDGHTQEEVASALKVNKSSVSRRLQAHGISALLTALRLYP
jgi:hypothetical protein